MANWWEDYKKKNGVDREAEEARQKTSAAPQRASAGQKQTAPYTPSTETTAAAQSPTWWEDYKRSNDIYAESRAATEHAANMEKQRVQNQQSYELYKAAQARLSMNRMMDSVQDNVTGIFSDLFASDSEKQRRALERSMKRYERDMPLYQQAVSASSYSPRLYDQASKQANLAYSSINDEINRYNDAITKANEDRLASLYETDRGAYYGETMSRQDIEAALAEARSAYEQARSEYESASSLSEAGYASMAPSYQTDLKLGSSNDQERRARQARIDAAKQKMEEAQAVLAQYQSASQHRASIELRDRLVETAKNDTDFSAKAETGRGNFERNLQQEKASPANEEKIKNEKFITSLLGSGTDTSLPLGTMQMSVNSMRAGVGMSDMAALSSRLNNLDEDLKNTFYYWYGQSRPQAVEYLDYAEQVQKSRDMEKLRSWSKEHPVLGTLSAAGANMVSGADFLSALAEKTATGKIGEHQDNTAISEIRDTMHEGVSDNFNTEVGKFLYQVGTSLIDSRIAMATGNTVPMFFLSASSSEYLEAKQRGASDEQALLSGALSGLAECIFEEVSVEKLINRNKDAGKSLIRKILEQSFTEASEEVTTSLANTISDTLLSNAYDFETKVESRARELMATGVSAEEAKKQAGKEWALELLRDAAAGALSGGASQVLYSGVHYRQNRAYNQSLESTGKAAIGNKSVDSLRQYALDNNLEWYGVKESEENAKPGKLEARQTGSDVERIEAHIQEQISGKSLQEQQEIRDQLQDKYGDGILPSVYQAISIDAAQRADKLSGSDAIREARNKEAEQIQDADMRRAVVDGYDQAVFSRAMHGGDADEASRYFQQLRNTGTGDMTMEATVEGEDGQSKQVAITGMSEDGKSVVLSDGVKIAVKNLQADADTMDALQQLTDLDLGKDANAVLQAYKASGVTGNEGYRWLMDYATAYNQGRTRQISLDEAAKRSSLDEKTVMDAYTLGQKSAYQETQKGLDRVKNLPKKQGATGRVSNIDTSEIRKESMNESELEQFEMANKYISLLGVDLKWFSSKEKNGRYVGKNGAYENGKVYMDIHAGRDFTADLTSGIMATISHELSHFQQQYAPKEYQALKEFLFQQIVKNSKDGELTLERLIWDKQRRSGYKLSRRQAEDEVVADACQKMLRDSKAVQEFAKENKEATNGIIQWLDKWFKKIKEIFGRGGNFSEEAQLMDSLEKDVKKAFGDLWDAGLREAVRVHDEVGNIENTAQEGGEQLSLREAEKIGYDKLIDQYYNGTLRRANPIYIGSFSSVTGTLFGSTAPLIITGSDLTKSTRPDKGNSRSAHALSESFVRSLPQKINKAQFGYTETRNNVPSFTIVVQDEKSGKLYAVGGALNAQYENRPVNRVLSVFEIGTPEQFLIKEGKALVSKNMNTAKTILEKAGIQSPALQNILDRMRIVSQRGRNVNGQNSDRDYMEAVENGDMETAQRMVDEAAKQAGYPLKLMHGTNSFGFTTVNFNESDDKVSFFATDNEEVAGSYVRPMDDYDDEPSTYVRPIGKPVKNRITQSSSVGDILAELKRLAPDSYRDTNAATKAQIQEKVDEQLSYVRDIARQLDRFSLPERLQTMAQKVMEAKSAQVAVELVESVDDIHEIISNGMYFEQAMSKLDNLRANTNTLKKWAALTPETVAIRTIGNRTSLVDKNHLYDAYLDNTGLSGRGIYEIYTTENNPLRINCRGNRWNNIPLSGEMATDLGERATTREISKWAHDHGYGMVEFDNVKDTGKYGSQFTPASTVYAFLEGGGNNFKSADAVTYDDNGDVIPLSERFSDKNELRYSERDGSVLTPEEARRLLDGRAQEDLDKLYAEFAEAINAPKSLDPKQIYNLYRDDVENDKVSYGLGPSELKRGREIIQKIKALETSLQQFMEDLQSVPVDEFTVRLTPPKEYGLFISESTNSLMIDSSKRIADEAEKLYQDFKSGNRRDEKRFREYVKKLYALSQKAGEPFYVYGIEYNPKGKRDTDIRYSERSAETYTDKETEKKHYGAESAADGVRFSLRTEQPPTKTQSVYKLMRLGKDGNLYPLFIDSASGIEVGKWYDADSPDFRFLQKMPEGVFLVDTDTQTYTTLEDYQKEHGDTRKRKLPTREWVDEATRTGKRWMTIEPSEKSVSRYGGETRRYYNVGINGSGSVSTFALRPGWHAGSLPTMRQIGKGVNKNLRDDTFVWVQGRVPADIDYQAEAERNVDKDIPTKIPKNGYYLKATNANATASQADRVGWYVAGSFIADRIMGDAETREVIDRWNAAHPNDEPVEYDYDRESGKVFNAETMQLEERRYSERDNAKPRSAQAQRDAGYKLSESKFYSLYFAHKLDLRHRGDVLDQIENIKAEGFKGDGGFGNNVMPSRQYVSYPYREKYKLIKELEEKGGYGFEPGYADRWKAELGDEFDKPFPENLSVKAYGPRKGEYILLVPKSGVEVRGSKYASSERVRPGYKPAFDYEIVQADYDYQPYYEMYSKAYDRVMAAQKVNVDIDTMSQSAAPSDTVQYSERTWTASRFVQDRENAAKALAKALDVTQKQAEKYIDDINSVARAIADDRARLDYMSSPGRSAFKSNVEYGGSIDFSTLCKKRQLLTGTFNAIQHALANTVLTAEDVLRIRQMMQDAGLEVNCGMCYVEGSRARMGEYNKTFLELYRKYYPDNWQPKMEDVNTTDGLELMRMEHPEAYEQYEYFYNNHGTLRSEDKAIFSSQAKPKEYQLRTEYKGEIREKFKNESNVETKNRNGGLRMQSFSDFEIVHLIDCMQVIMDMSEVGLAGQAYTKVPEFAEALGLTGLKINLSLVAKGVDKNGKLIFNDVEGMPHERAFGIREKYSENVGTILVVYDDAQLLAALADDKVDYIIPFHRSQLRKSQYAAMGLPKTTKDYTYQQNEKWLNPKDHTHKYRDKVVPTKCTNYMPNEYWDFSLSGTENARRYLEMCAKDGKRPKFYKLLQNSGNGTFSLKADGSTDGYWKLLIDFKMYDNNGVGVPQQPVQPIFDMENAMQMLDNYSGDPSRFPVAEGIVDEFVSQYKAEHPGRQYSERDYSQKSDYEILRELDPMTAASDEELRKNLEMTQKRIDKVRSQQYELNGLRKQIAAATGEKRAALEQKAKVLQGKITGNVREIDKSLNTSSMQNLLKAQRAEARRIATQQFMDRRGKKNIRDRIKNLHAEMNRDLLRPREGHFVPEALIRPVVDLLDLVNTQTNRAKSESAQARIDAINAAYDKIRNDERYSMYYDETVKGMLVELSATLAGRNIYELSADELADVYTAMKAMRTTIRNAIKADLIEKGKEIFEVGNELRQELRSGRGASPYLIEKYHMAMLSGKRAFNRFGGYRQDSTWNKVYKMLDDAQLKMLNLEMLATRIFDPVLKAKEDFEKAQDLTSIKEKDLVDVGLKDADGNTVKITRGMMLGLYMHLQNEENMRHIMYGGLTLPDFKRYYKGSDEAWGRGTVEIPALGAKVSNLEQLLEEQGEAWVDEKYAEYKAEIEELFESVRQNIEEQLTDYDRKWITASKDFFDNFSRRELNAVTNEMYGFSKAKVDNYFPIVTDSNFLKSEFDSISRNISLENAGFMKERVKASNPILLEDITRTVNRQISNVSRYAGLTQALKQFGNVYNVQTKGFTDSVKKAMAKSYGKNGQAYVQNLITDMIGGRSTPGSIFDRIKGNYAQAVLSANFSVTIKQAASFPTAAATVGWGPIMKALAKGGRNGSLISRADRALIDTYSPLLWKRSQGAIDTEIGDMAHAQDWTKKAKWLMGWIEKTDIATVGRLWYAAEYYVKDNFKGLEKGSAEQIKAGESPFYQKVAEVFTDIVEDTQPNYTVLQRPDILRNPNKLVRAMTMFSTQRFQNANILIDAVGEYDAMRRADKKAGTEESKAARTEARKKLTRAISSQVVSAVVLNVMTLVGAALLHRMNPWRDDDDEITASSIAEEYLNGFLSTMAGSFLGGSELYEAVSSLLTGSKYYGNDVGGISTINEFATAVVEFGQKAVKLIGDEESKPEDWSNLAKKQLWKVGEYLSQMTGVPVANIRKILEGGRDHIIDAVNGEFFSFEAGVDRSNATNARRFYRAWETGDKEKMQDVLEEVRRSGKSQDSVANAFNKAAKEAYQSDEISLERYAEYLEKTGMFDGEKIAGKLKAIVKEEYQAGERSEDATIDVLTDLCGMDGDKAWKTVQEWEAKAEHADEEDYSYSQYEDLREALDEGKSLKEAGADYLAHGYTEKQITDAAVDHLKDRYLAGEISEDEAVKTWAEYKGKDENDAWMAVQRWEGTAAHANEEDYSFSQYDAIDEAIAANKDIKALVKELTDHGVEEKNISSHVKSYLVDRYVAGGVTETAMKNQLSRYLGIVAKDDVDKILNDANSKKQYGVNYSSLDEEYRAGNIKASEMKSALMKYGGLSAADAEKKIRWYDLQKANPSLEISESKANAWYDGTSYTKTNGHESAKAAGMSIQDYLRAKDELANVKGVDANNDGRTDTGSREIAYIRTLTAMSWLTDRQRRALYYEEYKGTSKTSGRPW